MGHCGVQYGAEVVKNCNSILRALSHFNEAVTAREIADFLNKDNIPNYQYSGYNGFIERKWSAHSVAGNMLTLWNMDLIENGEPIKVEGEPRDVWEYGEKKGVFIPIYEIKTYRLTVKAMM